MTLDSDRKLYRKMTLVWLLVPAIPGVMYLYPDSFRLIRGVAPRPGFSEGTSRW